MPTSLTKRQTNLGHLRLISQRIVASSFVAPVDAVRWLLAMQAQDFTGAKWAVGLRVPGCTDADVEAALAAGTIVRSWPMRGTLHVCAAEDLHWMLAVTAPRMITGSAGRRKQLELDDATLVRAQGVAETRLSGGKALTRADLLTAFNQAGIATTGQRGYHLLWHLAQTGCICFGPTDGKQQTFVRLDEWVRHPRLLEREEALGEFAARYFRSHGPATLQDFAWWTKLTLRDAKVGLAIARRQLVELIVEDTSYWLAPETDAMRQRSADHLAGSVAALPGFDEYLLGYTDRSGVLAPEHFQQVVPGNNGMFLPMIVVDGQIVGTWRRAVTGGEVVVQALPFVSLMPAAARGLTDAISGYGRFLGVTGRVDPSSVTGTG